MFERPVEMVTIFILLDPRGETEKAYKIAVHHQWLPKSMVTVERHVDDGATEPMVIRMREKRYLHPKSSNVAKAAWNRDPWKKNPDGTDFSFDSWPCAVTLPRWLADRNGFAHSATVAGMTNTYMKAS